jgi:hypothetical protein
MVQSKSSNGDTTQQPTVSEARQPLEALLPQELIRQACIGWIVAKLARFLINGECTCQKEDIPHTVCPPPCDIPLEIDR